MSMKTLEPLSEHMLTCDDCRTSFAQYTDDNYCAIGRPLFDAWQADTDTDPEK